jgi:hypothetical protein
LVLEGAIVRAVSRLGLGLLLLGCAPSAARGAADAPGPAAAVRIAPPAAILVDGSGGEGLAVLEVTVVDAAGRPAEDVPVGSGGQGEFRDALLVEPGRWAVPYRPPLVLSDTTEHVVVKAGAASARVDLELLIRRPTLLLGVKAGVAVAGGRMGPGVGLEAGVWTVLGRAQMGLLLEGGWWTLSSSATATTGGVESSYGSTQNYFPVMLSLGWRIPVADAWALWLTAGGGGAVVSSRVELSGQKVSSESGFAPAASGSFSAGPRLGPGYLFLEARATWIGDPGLSTVTGSAVTILGFLGYRFDVG